VRLYASAREFFEAARDAVREAERIGRQLDAMESAADGLGGSGFESRVRSTPDPTRGEARVVALVDHGARLEERRDECYRIIDSACEVLYGTDNHGGLWALCGWRADAIFHHYLALRTWDATAEMLGYSTEHVKREASAAMDVADAWGMASTVMGVGGASD